MKKIILFLLLSVSLNIYSQDKSFDFGIRTGGGLSFLVGNKSEISYGLTNGISFAYNSPKTFFLQADLLIERKTARHFVTFTNDIGNSIGVREVIGGGDIIQLYIMPGYKTKGKTKLLLSGGIFGGIFFNSHETIFPSEHYPEKEVYNDPIKGVVFDFGISASIGVQHPITEKLIFTIENRFNVSIENFMRGVHFDFANNNLMLGLAYRFSKNN